MSRKTRNQWRLGSFEVDVSPPIGHALCGGLVKPAQSVLDPVHARGLVLDDGARRVVICVVEYTAISDMAHERWRRAIARGAGCPVESVLLHAGHQHDTAWASIYQDDALRAVGENVLNRRWFSSATAKVQAAAAEGAKKAVPLTAVGVAEHRVSDLASNRRLIGPDGRVAAMRFSWTRDASLRTWPVGLIDPLLRTITFHARGRVIASATFYATHPQVAYDRGMVSADVPGEALRRVGDEYPRATHLYLTGCAADITFGKYTTDDPQRNVRVLGGRLGEGICRNLDSVRPEPPGDGIEMAHDAFAVPVDPAVNETWLLDQIESGKCDRVYGSASHADAAPRAASAMMLGALRYARKIRLHPIAALRFGPATVLSLPAEVFVAYQLHAQSLIPERFLATAAYGEGSLMYIPTDEAFAQGGYEPTMSITEPGIEASLKGAIERVLCASD